MSTRTQLEFNGLALLLLVAWPALGNAQVPVDDNGEAIGDYSTVDENRGTGNEDIPLLANTELEELVGPIALYPDDLLAIVLPASAYPLQIAQAGRFLDELEDDPSLQPDESWDDSVVALINYPEVVRLLNDDLDWTWRLGEAVVAQQADVIAAVETFRDRAYAAGNLKSDEHQTVSRDEGYIEITPVEDDVIYVPYYEPERVVVYQPRPVYYYYPDPCPVYYYPYPSSYAFNRGYFWGVTTAFTVGWHSDRLRVFHHSYRGHPYYGRYYWPRWRYRQPTLNVYNNIYVNRYSNRSRDHYRSGDNWRPRDRRTVRNGDERVTRTRHYPQTDAGDTTRTRTGTRAENRSRADRSNLARSEDGRSEFKFRERPKLSSGAADRNRSADNRRTTARRDTSDRVRRESRREGTRSDIKFRDRPKLASDTTGRKEAAGERRATSKRDSGERRATSNRDTSARKRAAQDRVRRDTDRVASRDARSQRSQAPAPRHTQARRTESYKSESRRSAPRRSESGRSESGRSERKAEQRRHSESRASKSGKVKVADGSRKERVKSRERRH